MEFQILMMNIKIKIIFIKVEIHDEKFAEAILAKVTN